MGKGGGCIPSKNRLPAGASVNDAPNPVPIDAGRSSGSSDAAAAALSREQGPAKKLRIFIVFYSMYGHVEGLAKRMKKGVDGVEGFEGVLYRVPETLKTEVLEQMKAATHKDDDHIPIISAEELVEADGLLFGFPTRYGSMAAQMKAFFDSTGNLWKEQKLAGIPAGFFVSTGTQGGGQETTA